MKYALDAHRFVLLSDSSLTACYAINTECFTYGRKALTSVKRRGRSSSVLVLKRVLYIKAGTSVALTWQAAIHLRRCTR
jgi:hypothetical protein